MIILFLGLTMMAHEIGHGLMMRHYGVEIEEIGLGLGPTIYQTTFNYFQNSEQKAKGIDIPLSIRPIPVTAYVMPSDAGAEVCHNLPYSDQTKINGVGAYANIIFGLIMLVIYLLFFSGLTYDQRINYPFLWVLVFLVGSGWLSLENGDGFYWDYFYPILGSLILLIAIIGWVGPIWGKISQKMNPTIPHPGRIRKISDACYYGAELSFILAMFNITPLFPLDGGKTMALVVASYMPSAVKYFENISFLALIFIVIQNWTGNIFSFLFRRR